MSKIGRKPIDLAGVQVDVKGQDVHFKGARNSGVHALPDGLHVEKIDNKLRITCDNKKQYAAWGLHRALLANEIKGAAQGFEQKITIIGLGFKAVSKGSNALEFSLGFSHKIPFVYPKTITIEIDKTGQNLSIKGSDKEEVGHMAQLMCELRPVEPYKGTGVNLAGKAILRKAGKAKAGA